MRQYIKVIFKERLSHATPLSRCYHLSVIIAILKQQAMIKLADRWMSVQFYYFTYIFESGLPDELLKEFDKIGLVLVRNEYYPLG